MNEYFDSAERQISFELYQLDKIKASKPAAYIDGSKKDFEELAEMAPIHLVKRLDSFIACHDPRAYN